MGGRAAPRGKECSMRHISSLRGQTVTLTFTTYDRGDTIYDSATLIDSVSIS